ncbi:MAG: hypothetical protein HY723_06385 [Chloroflexi bacterium]|nr:hypothetical protein [Chloroflexota bacterium]
MSEKGQRKPKASRRERRINLAGVDQSLVDALKTTYSLPTQPAPIEQAEAHLGGGFATEFPQVASLWSEVCSLYTSLAERRATLGDKSTLRTAIDFLGIKGFCEARAAHLLISHGYALASFGPLRAAQEACELMQYLLIHPEEADAWLREEEKFDDLSWVRKQVRITSAASYSFMNWGLHPNAGLIGPLLGISANAADTHLELMPGPFRNTGLAKAFSTQALFWALGIVGLMCEQRKELVSQIWRDRYEVCCGRLGNVMEDVVGQQTTALEMRKALARVSASHKGAQS